MPRILSEALFELGIQSFYTGNLETGRWACECLLSLRDVPDEQRQRTRINQIYYAPLLPTLVPSATIRPILFPVPPPWSRFNPSVAVHGDGYRAIVRSSNYTIDISPSRYTVLTGDELLTTHNYLVRLDGDLAPHSATLIKDRTGVSPPPPFSPSFEDCRLFHWRGTWYATASLREYYPLGPLQLCLLRLEDSTWEDLHVLSDPAATRNEIEWMPFTSGNDLFFVYSCSPTIILRYRDGRVDEVSKQPAPAIARQFHGGSQGVAVEDGFLFIVHESIPLEDETYTYPHRFILLDRNFRIARLSTPFYFLHRSLEVCCGLARRDQELVISFGFQDREAYIARVSIAEVLATLRPVHQPAPATQSKPPRSAAGVLHRYHPPNRSYLIWATPRTGSYYLCGLMAKTGVAGYPVEFTNDLLALAREKPPRYPSSESRMEYLVTSGTTPNGVFGSKVIERVAFFEFLGQLFGAERLSDAELLELAFPGVRHIYLFRRDTVRQAVSYVRAAQSDQWRRDIPNVQRQDPWFDFGSIDRSCAKIIGERAAWRRFFARHGIEPLELVYEDDLLADPDRGVRRVLEYVELPVINLPSQYERPSWSPDPLIEEWTERYLAMR